MIELTPKEIQNGELFLNRPLNEFRRGAGMPGLTIDEFKKEITLFRQESSKIAAERQREEGKESITKEVIG